MRRRKHKRGRHPNQKRIRVGLCMPAQDEVRTQFALSLASLINYTHSHPEELPELEGLGLFARMSSHLVNARNSLMAQAMQAGLMQGHIVTTPGEMITELAHRKVQVDVSPVNVGKLSDSLEGRAFADGRLTESELGSDADARALGRAVAARVCKHLGMTDEGCVKMKGLDNVTPQLGSSAEFMVPRQLPMSDKKVQDAIKLAINQLAAER